MHDLLAPTGLLLATAITPGPNNLVVLREAGRAGVRGAVRAIGAIVLGGLVLLAVVATGAGTMLAAHPTLRITLDATGVAYMAWLGLRLLAGGAHDAPRRGADTFLPAGAFGLFGFQFLNPKGWAMVLTVVAGWPAARMADYLPLVPLFVLIPLACLLLWSLGGRWLAPRLQHAGFRRRTDAAMGALLLASAALLLVDL
jgi:threonine/homoserine/homoserine lactone efflux protein